MELTSLEKNLSNQSLGNLTYYQSTEHGIEGSTSNGVFRINVVENGVFQIKIARDQFDTTISYAVCSHPQKTKYVVEDEDDRLIISTSNTQLIVTKNPVRIALADSNGEIINQDDPAFGTSWIGEQVTTYKSLLKNEKFIGLGEKTGPLNRRGKGYQNWNTDHFGYGPDADPLYVSIPFYIGINDVGVYGVFLDNSYKTHFNFGASNQRFSSFSADAGEMNYYLFHSDDITGIIKRYTNLTGKTAMPPLWSLGYQQCRYSYYPDKEVYAVANTFREKDIPADAIVMDIHYMDKYKIFSWDKNRFPDPEGMIKKLKQQGFKIVVMCDPGIKIEEGYGAYEDGLDKDVFIKYPDGENYSGAVWPGWCHFPDFTKPETRDWWAKQLKYYADQGISGYWNDMNEIATWGQYLPELMNMDFDGNPESIRRGRNLYGLQMSRSSMEGAKENLKNERPFVLTRSGFAGIQRYSAVWTGDNVANDEHMLLGVRLVNSLGLSGVGIAGYDVGGFVGNANEHLYARWIQLGSFSAFFRGHTMINSRDSEPWAYGEEVEDISRNYIKLRYKLMNYLYSAVREASVSGIPVARSLAIDYYDQEEVFDGAFHNQYMYGPSLMIAPVESYKNLVKVFLPEGNWVEFFTDKPVESGVHIAESPIYQLPVFVKESSIIPVCPEAAVNTENLGKSMEFHVYNGSVYNSYQHYEDDGISYDFENQSYHLRDIEFIPAENALVFHAPKGEYPTKFSTFSIILHGFDEDTFVVNGINVESKSEDYQFIQPISNFDPFREEMEGNLQCKGVKRLHFDYSKEEIKITW